MSDVIIAVLGSSVISTLITTFVNRLDKKDNVNKALMYLLGWSIREGCEEAIRKKKITLKALEQLEEMNAQYKAMNGNGYVHNLITKVESLPIVED